MKAILCAIDLSGASESALRAAMELAAEKQTNVIALFAYRLLEPNGEGLAEYRRKMESTARDAFHLLLKKVQADGKMAPVDFITEIGFMADRIDHYVRSSKVSYIVLSRQLAISMNEHKGLTFNHFINTIRIPVLIVPEAVVETV